VQYANAPNKDGTEQYANAPSSFDQKWWDFSFLFASAAKRIRKKYTNDHNIVSSSFDWTGVIIFKPFIWKIIKIELHHQWWSWMKLYLQQHNQWFNAYSNWNMLTRLFKIPFLQNCLHH
jgi:hypothetical protein